MEERILVADAMTATLPPPVPRATIHTGRREAPPTAWSAGAVRAGVWEHEPGEFSTARAGREVGLSGLGTFTGEDGHVAELVADGTVLVPNSCVGGWRIHETTRKTFVIVPAPSDTGSGGGDLARTLAPGADVCPSNSRSV